MIIPLEPKLEGLAERRFFSFAQQMLDRQAAEDPERIGALVESEAQRAARLQDVKSQCEEYTACVRVLGDLAQLRWRLVESGYGLELHSPRPRDERVSGTAAARRRKEVIRNELRPRLRQQFSDPNVRKFIRRMEFPPAASRRKSVRTLIADGAELKARLSPAHRHRADRRACAEALRGVVRPYLQLVESGLRDDRTGLLLGDVWRYFRYTWSIPQTPIPGRNLLYLVRDAAHATHAVVGIAALSNCAVQLTPRDRAVGWSLAGLVEALTLLLGPPDQRAAREASDPAWRLQGPYQWLKPLFPAEGAPSPAAERAALARVVDWLLLGVSAALGEIERRGLAAESEIAAPTPQTAERLRRLSREFASHRHEALAGRSDGDESATPAADVPVDDDVLALEAKHSSNHPVHNSRRMLVRKKRAFELARLLDARRVLTAKREDLADPAIVFDTLEQAEVGSAMNAALSAIKSRRIGTNLLEISTCGAVPPYNLMLGGKLVALLMLSPEVAADYRRRYGREATIIRSQLKNARVVPDNRLVWLGTTSLFAHNSSQYERLRLPAGVIAPDQPEIRYTYLGNTTGYGTVQFADDTVRALDGLLRSRRGFRDVNGVFGEGASPRLRKLRAGLDAIGFDANLVMLHHQGRRIYGAPLFAKAGAYLCGLETDVPAYVSAPESYADGTERIAEFWRRRWLSSRLAHDASWVALGETPPRLLSSTMPLRKASSPDVGNGDEAGGGGGAGDGGGGRLEFWRRLAEAGSKAVSEGLTDAEFHALHVETRLDEYLTDRARRAGLSIVLTGAAGDGKTHLARALRRRLAGDAERFDFAFDATAIMNGENGVAPVVERWRRATSAGKGLVLAINQYPLYKLRQRLPDILPDVSEQIERQLRARLVTGPGGDPAANDSLLLVDLSLRNPLSRDFAGRVLNRMLTDPAVRKHARSGSDPNFSFNFERLGDARVQERLFKLFDRVISSGRRTTVRELWILIARLLFGASAAEDAPGVPQAWYSERLFAPDPRFPLIDALQSVADPAAVSHPHVDRGLEARAGMRADQWLAGGAPDRLPASALVPAGDEYRDRFLALKRRFYFEHADGGDRVFDLDPRPHARFHDVVRNPDADIEHLGRIVAAVNRCYFPHPFDGSRDKLCLWIGHRLDEQPTKSYVAGECIPRERLGILRPRPPGALRDALNYLPDHVILSVSEPHERHGRSPAEVELRIDAGLFGTLSEIVDGLPRHLVNPGELNRLDTFIDRLRGLTPSPLPEFLVYNAEHVVSTAVKMSPAFDRYVETRRL